MSSDPYVRCPRCGGEGGHVDLKPAHSSAATSPREKYVRCEQCDGTGRAHVRTLTDEQWSNLS